MHVFSEPKNDRCFGRMRIEIPCLEWGHAAILTFLNSSNETNRARDLFRPLVYWLRGIWAKAIYRPTRRANGGKSKQ
jgi:hypothetical protein